jgi:hypothetical protein
MGYYINNWEVSYDIKASDVVAIKTKIPDFFDKLDGACFIYEEDNSGDLFINGWEGEKWHDSVEEMCLLLGKYDSNGYSRWVGEDDSRWEYQGTQEVDTDFEEARTHEVLVELLEKYPEEAALYSTDKSVFVRDAAKKALGN